MDTQTASEGRLARIERGLDRELANAMPISRSTAGTLTIAPQSMGELLEFAKLMSLSDFCIRPGFRGNPGACLAVALQAFRCGGDPFAWANKAYIVKSSKGEETVSYEAQLIHAVVTTSNVLQRRLRAEYSGEGIKRRCKIVGYLKGEDQPFEYESPPVEQIAVKNSPLWTGDRDQQLFYYATRAWARRHVPEILLGIYAPEEMGDVIDMESEREPEPQMADFRRPEPEPEPERFAVVALDGEVFEFETADGAEGALRTVLEGARRGGAKMLEAAIENNQALIDSLGEAIIAEFSPPASTAASPPRAEAPAPASAPGPGRAASPEPVEPPPAREGPPPAPTPPEPVEPPAAPPQATPAPFEEDDRFPGDLPSGERLIPRHGNGQTEPPPPARPTKSIPVPQARGRPDYRTFVRGLLIPKIRQQTDGNELAFLLGDNADAIEGARGALARQDVAELDEAIEAAWARLR